LPRAPREAPETRAVGGRLRPDLFVAGGIALFAAGLVFSAVGKLRAQHEVTACQNALRTLHTGLAGYADTHEGRYPQGGVAAAAAPAAGPVCPHGWGMNVLFVGGHVRVTTSQFVGPGEDDIFRNRLGQVAAGVDRTDVVLGRPGDRP